MVIQATTGTPRRGRLRILVLLAIAVLAGAGAAGYFAFRPRKVVLPVIAREGLDAEVAALIDHACTKIASNPGSADTWGHLGMALFAQNMYTPSIGVFAEAERRDPREPRWPYFGGLALMLERPREGIVRLERAAALAPGSFHVRLRLAEQYLKLQRIDEADSLFGELSREDPTDARVLLGRGQILSHRGWWQEALEPLRSAANDPTARRSARVALAEAHARAGNAAKAEAQRKLADTVAPDLDWADPYFDEARVFRTGLQPRIDLALDMMKKGQFHDAHTLMLEVLRDHPQSDEALLTLAKVLIGTNQLDRAENALRHAIAINPKLIDGHYYLGQVAFLRKDFSAAEQHFRQATELKPAYAQAQALLGECRLKQGNKPGAITAFRAAVRYLPDLAAAHVDLGALLLEDGKTEEASKHLEMAVRLDGKNERARKLLEQARRK